MNKKIVIFSILGLIAVVMGIVFFLTRPLPLGLEKIFPANALVYIQYSRIAADVQAISQNGFWKAVGEIDIPHVLQKNNFSVKDVENFKSFRLELDAFLKNPLTEKFLGKEIAIAFYEKASTGQFDSPESYDLLLATRLGIGSQMAESLISMAKQWSEDVTTTIEQYQGAKIVHMHFKKRKMEIQYVRIKDVLFVSMAPSDILHKLWKVYQKETPSLSSDADFSKALTHAYQDGHALFYVNLKNMNSFLKQHTPPQQKEGVAKALEFAAGFKSYMVSFTPADISKIRMVMNFEFEGLSPYWQSMLNCVPSNNSTMKFVPHGVMAYQWSECYDFNQFYEGLRSSQQLSGVAQQEVDLIKNKIQKRYNINFKEDVFDALGTQMGWYLNEIDTKGFFPYPRMVVFVKFKDPVVGENLLKKFRKTPLGALQQEEYQKKLMYSFSLPFGANMDIGYTFLDDFLLLGTSKQLLKTSIDAFTNTDQSLQSTQIIKQFHLDSNQANHSVAFVKISEIATRLQQLLDWYNKAMSSQITAALTAQQQGDAQIKELEEQAAAKKEEFLLAQKRLKSLQSKSLPMEATPEEQANHKDNLEHLAVDVNLLKEELDSYEIQKQELKDAMADYQQRSEQAKVWLFNSDEVFVPILKGLTAIQAFSVQIRTSKQFAETEILVK